MDPQVYREKVIELAARADSAIDTLREESKKSLALQDIFTAQEKRIKESFDEALDELTTGFIMGCEKVAQEAAGE